ncbi:zinc finger protein basonuclin-2-like isoform X2 [Scylla paramamosain]|uniref:zinc finger protein basonuclin-2-like isoform X2 n=2 Tax=Scylla paramamosain TaxID=85552 RepID=UPI003082F7F4
MLGVESKPNDTDRFKPDSHEIGTCVCVGLMRGRATALENLGIRGVFSGGLGGSFGGLSASLGAALSMSGERGGVGVGVGVGPRESTVTSGVGVGLGVVPEVRAAGVREKEGGLELVKPSLVLDIASLILYGCQALPIRLKILLDRLFSVLTHEDVLQVLHGFGWTYEDYARGYKLQDRQGNVLHSWHMMSPEEETLVLRQFLRFGETRAIAQQLLQHDGSSPRPDHLPPLRDHRDPLRDRESHRESLRDLHRETHRDPLRDLHRDAHRDLRDLRDRDPVRDFRDELRRDEGQREEPPRSQPSHHHPPPHHPHQPDLAKMDPEIKKFLERTNMLFSPFMRGDHSSLLRPPPPTGPPGLPPAPPPLSAASLASNLLAVANPSLATSLLANPQLASSALSMLRLPVPPVSLPNISPNGSLPNSFGSPTSPIGGSPLNRLQSMQPYDIRKERQSPSPAGRGEPSLSHGGRGGGVTSPASSGGGVQVNSSSGTVTPLAASAGQPPPPTPVSINSDPPTDYTSDDDDISFSSSTTALNLSTTSTTVATSSTPTTLPMPPRPQSPGCGNNPGKRSWNPINLGTSLINPVTGKKRVQCNVCLKTFCDKGALKIHFSAVHLREMHKCTVEGCNMMFSSRRSRNRHSANPNPKLHTPHVRRKISPHDGRTSAAHPVIPPHLTAPGFQPPAGFPPLGSFPGQFGGINPLTGLPFIPPSASATEDLHKQTLELQRRTLEMQQAMGKSSLDLTMRSRDEGLWRGDYGLHHSGLMGDDIIGDRMNSENSDQKRGRSDDDYHSNNNLDADVDDDSMSVDAQSMKGEGTAASPSANKRKRKSQNPTKFAFRLEDDDLISTDDDDDDDNDDDLDDIDAKDSEDDKNEDKELDAMSDDDDDTDDTVKEGSSLHSGGDKSKNDKDSDGSTRKVSSSSFDETVDTSNALRHLEDLSRGHFAHLAGALPPNASASLGLQMAPSGNGVSSSSPRPSDRDSERDSNPGSPSEDSDGAFQFGEGGFLSSLNIPIDKENPRRCIACGKIFQNHFGVKTHYQNVHLKLMHKCTVEGCNAAFPSKRSRDRHSSNLNLHRKLLSTSADGPGFPSLTFPGLPFNPALNPELLARLYSDPSGLPLGLEALKAHIPTSLAESLFNGDRGPGGAGGGDGNGSNGSGGGGLPPTHPPPHFFLPNLLPHFAANNNLPGTERKDRSGTPSPQSTTPTTTTTTSTTGPPICEASSPPPQPEEPSAPTTTIATTTTTTTTSSSSTGSFADEIVEHEWVYNLEDDLPTPDREGNMPCKFCHKTFEDGIGLKSHYDEAHAAEMFRCTVSGCNKVFSSRRKRNTHSLNEALHQHTPEGAATGTT